MSRLLLLGIVGATAPPVREDEDDTDGRRRWGAQVLDPPSLRMESARFTHGRPRRAMGGPALAETCPRCKAPPGQPCDPRTLGRHPFHMARVRAVG